MEARAHSGMSLASMQDHSEGVIMTRAGNIVGVVKGLWYHQLSNNVDRARQCNLKFIFKELKYLCLCSASIRSAL